ncbi:Transcriptional regulator, TrmB family [Methanosarcina sp. MTP4]|uniref:TrmB family transcriptional regulator n=1 Tax=Methanosarcina sp. MTP4 TaxID=1434100 RepID=UPI00061610AB|nr:helix-turn-helix domain-containing protein [Methanosarcina sp. MTP4]AKB25806.1 Transcriptional regulator, TrmB family [Methanosarcina sp. MTP4]
MSLKLIDNLQKLGFTENEAKTYVGLLSLTEATAREIHEITNVPRPKIYGVLERMSKKGYVEVKKGNPTYFRGLNPEQLTERLRKEFLFSLNETLKELNSVSYGIESRCS